MRLVCKDFSCLVEFMPLYLEGRTCLGASRGWVFFSDEIHKYFLVSFRA